VGLVNGFGVGLAFLVLGERAVDAGQAGVASFAFAGGDDQVEADVFEGLTVLATGVRQSVQVFSVRIRGCPALERVWILCLLDRTQEAITEGLELLACSRLIGHAAPSVGNAGPSKGKRRWLKPHGFWGVGIAGGQLAPGCPLGRVKRGLAKEVALP